MNASASANAPGERIGGVNRLFARVVSIRLCGEPLKARSRIAYYALKYAVLAALIGLFIWV